MTTVPIPPSNSRWWMKTVTPRLIIVYADVKGEKSDLRSAGAADPRTCATTTGTGPTAKAGSHEFDQKDPQERRGVARISLPGRRQKSSFPVEWGSYRPEVKETG